MNLNDFKYIIAVAEAGSYSAAAKSLFITQPSLSQRVKFIEGEYGISIFSRDSSGVHLTREGEHFLRYARRILNDEADLRAEIAYHAEKEQSVLRFGISWAIDALLFQNLVAQVCTRYPQLRFEIIEQSSLELQDSLLSNKIDVAICYLPVTSPDLTYRVIINDAYVLFPAAGGTLERRIRAQGLPPGSYIPPAFLNHELFSTCPTGSFLQRYLAAIIEAEQITPDVRHIIKSIPMLFSLAEKGIASTILFRSYLSTQTEQRYYFLDSSISNSLPVALTWRKGSPLAYLAQDLIAVIQESIRK